MDCNTATAPEPITVRLEDHDLDLLLQPSREPAYRTGWLRMMADIELEESKWDDEDAEPLLWSDLLLQADDQLDEALDSSDDQSEIDNAQGYLLCMEWLIRQACHEIDLPPEELIRQCRQATNKWAPEPESPTSSLPPFPDPSDDGPLTIENCISRSTGFIQRYIEHHNLTAHRRQSRFALAGALALVGVLAGRKIRDSLNTRTNIYSVCVAPPATGKNLSRELNCSILFEAGAQQLIAPDEGTSDTAVGRLLVEHPAKLQQGDEIGRWLATADAAKNPHAYKLVSMLVKLWSEVTNKHYQPIAFADSAKNYAIDQPHLVLLGTTTPESFYDALGGSAIDDGLLSRFCIFIGDDDAERQKPKPIELPSELIDFSRHWFSYRTSNDNLSDQHPAPTTIESDRESERVYDRFADLCDRQATRHRPMASLWGRAYQKARQFGLIYACSHADIDRALLIDGSAASWGCDLSLALTSELCTIAESRLSRSVFERDCQEIMRHILAAKDYRLSSQQLSRGIRRLKARDRSDCMTSLVDQGRVIAAKDGKTTWYCDAGHYAVD